MRPAFIWLTGIVAVATCWAGPMAAYASDSAALANEPSVGRCLMGAWGEGIFDNDDALDFVSSIEATPDWRLVESLLRRVAHSGGYLEAPDGSAAVAAAALVAGIAPPNEEPLLVRLGPASLQLRDLAEAALDRVVGDQSELRELWEEGGPSSDWRRPLDEVRRRLKERQ